MRAAKSLIAAGIAWTSLCAWAQPGAQDVEWPTHGADLAADVPRRIWSFGTVSERGMSARRRNFPGVPPKRTGDELAFGGSGA